jgi:hypothetical protein
VEFLESGWCHVNYTKFRDANGSKTSGDNNAATRVDADSSTILQNYPWGRGDLPIRGHGFTDCQTMRTRLPDLITRPNPQPKSQHSMRLNCWLLFCPTETGHSRYAEVSRIVEIGRRRTTPLPASRARPVVARPLTVSTENVPQ